MLDRPLRAAILSAAGNPLVAQLVGRYGMQLGARRFVAGESAESFMQAARALNADGFAVAAGILGEGVRDAAAANEAARQYRELLQRFSDERTDANVAFKPTHLGLDLDGELAYENAFSVASTAERTGNTMRLDMEQSCYVDRTLALYRRLRERFTCVGFVLQSALYRSIGDLERMLPLEPNLRIVKGAYLERPEVAHPRKRDVDAAYARLVEMALGATGYTAIATHDPALIEHAKSVARRRNLPSRGRFEFQMLYGIARPLADSLLREGYRVRLAVPFGSNWFPYLMRRLAERPANLAFFLKGAFAR